MNTPRELGFAAVPEWRTHARCWMAWPCREELWGEQLTAARAAFARIARTIARFEPVTMIVRPDLVADASLELGRGISVLPMAHDDSWTRDTGPIFLARADGERAGAVFRFNGWGELWRPYEQDARMAEAILARIGLPAFRSDLVLEGGAIELDGEGTAMVCEPSVLDPTRNPGRSRAEVEQEFAAMLGVERTIWLPAGLMDDETKGHVDNVARFVAPGVVVIVRDAKGPHRLALEAAREVLERERDAVGRKLELVPVDLPKPRRRRDGRWLTASYANFYLANDAVILPAFHDPADQKAFRIFEQLFPEREIVMEEVLDILEGGGGIHCITRDEPAA